MFEGASDQFHQFLASRNSLPLPLQHLPFTLHASTVPNFSFPPFDSYNPSHHLPPRLPNTLHPLHCQSPTHDMDGQDRKDSSIVAMSLAVRGERPTPELTQLIDDSSWSDDEVFALLRIRSSMESWSPDFTWEHVSRKLLELGFRRSADKCKEKFEEENRYLDSNKNYGFAFEIEGLYQGGQPNRDLGREENHQAMEKSCREQKVPHSLEEHSGNVMVGKQCGQDCTETLLDKKRKKSSVDKFEMFKCFCENVVIKMMAQQEEMHNKLLDDMVKRDEEELAREEAWKKLEMEKMNKELDIMAREQAVAGDRLATVIEALKRFASAPSETSNENNVHFRVLKDTNPNTSRSTCLLHNPTSHTKNVQVIEHTSSSSESLASDLPHSPRFAFQAISKLLPSFTSNPYLHNSRQDNVLAAASITLERRRPSNPTSDDKQEVGRRWPRDEVLALINLRCSVHSNAEDRDGCRAPLWERISRGMSELGYRRSSKRCKEKWENINKYFRKTKDVKKKRSLDSRTCPYFHQLSTLYSQGKVVSHCQSTEDDPPTSSPSNRRLDQLNSHSVDSNFYGDGSCTYEYCQSF